MLTLVVTELDAVLDSVLDPDEVMVDVIDVDPGSVVKVELADDEAVVDAEDEAVVDADVVADDVIVVVTVV